MAKKTKRHVRKASSKSVSKGTKLTCRECGLVVRVVDDCGCVDPCDIMCCDQPMVCV